MVDVGSGGALHVIGNAGVDIQRGEALFLHRGRERPHSSLLYILQQHFHHGGQQDNFVDGVLRLEHAGYMTRM